MRLLALDCSTEFCSVALLIGDELCGEAVRAEQRHSELILPMAQRLLADAQTRLQALDAIAFGAGPGSFTGLRIACGVTQGLSYAADLPVVPVDTLLALAHASDANRVIAALDARMQEIYCASYVLQDGQWQRLSEVQVCAPQQVPAVSGPGWCGVGPGFAAYASALASRYGAQLAATRPELYPDARAIAQLGAQAFARGAALPADQAAPLYVRDKVALTVAEQRALRV